MKSGSQWVSQEDRWTFQNVDDASSFTASSPNRPGDPAITTNIAANTNSVNRTDGTRYELPTTTATRQTLGAALAEVLGRAGWSSGNSVAVVDNSDQDASANESFARGNFHAHESATTDSEPQLVINYTAGAGGTEFTHSVAGTISSAGAMVRQPQTSYSGTLAPAGALSMAVNRSYSGAVTSTGAIAKQAQISPNGSIASSGTLSPVRTRLLAVAGTIASTGTLIKDVAHSLAGSISPAGSLTKQAQHSESGSVASSGSLGTIKSATLSVAGTVASAATLVKDVAHSFSGTIDSSGSVEHPGLPQFARPDSDVTLNAWTDEGGGSTNIFQSINETSASDADYVISPNNPGTASFYEAGLSNVTDPVSSVDHTVRYRYQATGGRTANLTIQLRQGASTVIASQAHTNIPKTGWISGTFTLTGPETDSITSYPDLRMRAIPEATGGGAATNLYVSWFELEVPTATGGDTFTVDVAGAISSAGATIKRAQPVYAGVMASAGALLKTASVTYSGSVTSSGTQVKQPQISPNGTIASTGSSLNIRTRLIVLTGTIASVGSFSKHASHTLTATIASAGALVKQAQKKFTSSTTVAGTVDNVKLAGTFFIELAGTVSSAGSLLKQATHSLAATITGSGALSKQASQSHSGTVGSSGALDALKAATVNLAGSIASAGSLTKQISINLVASLSIGGAIAKGARRAWAGVVGLAGAVANFIPGTVFPRIKPPTEVEEITTATRVVEMSTETTVEEITGHTDIEEV